MNVRTRQAANWAIAKRVAELQGREVKQCRNTATRLRPELEKDKALSRFLNDDEFARHYITHQTLPQETVNLGVVQEVKELVSKHGYTEIEKALRIYNVLNS